MATTDILGLFMSPEQYQAQQLAQQQAAEQARAINFANLDPRGQANYGTFLGAQQLGRGIGGLLGVQDPQLQRIRQRQEIMQSINPANMQSLMAGIQLASERGDQELALSLTDFMNKQGSEMALAQQRQAQATRERVQSTPSQIAISREIGILQTNLDELKKTPETPERNRGIAILQSQLDNLIKQGPAGIQEAARIGDIERKQAEMRAQDVNAAESDEYKALDAEKMRLQRAARATGATDDEKKATAYANSVSADPDSTEWKTAFNSALNRLIFGKDSDKVDDVARLEKYLTDLSAIRTQYGTDTKGFENDTKAKALQILIDKVSGVKGSNKQFEKLAINDEIVRLRELQAGLEKDSSEYKVYQEQIDFLKGNTGKGKVSAFAQLLLDRDIEPGSKEWNTRMDAYITKESTRSEPADQITSIGETVAPNKEGLPAGLKVYSNKTNKTQYVLRDGKEVPYYGSVEPAGKTTVNVRANINMPTTAEGIVEYENKVRKTVESQIKTVDFVESAIANLNLAQLTDNASAFNAARMQLARSLGDSQISRADVENAGGDPAVYARIRDTVSSMIRGRPDDPTIDDIRRTLNALARVASRQGNATLTRQRRLAESAKDKQGARIYTDDQINLLFDFPQFNKYAGPNEPSGKGSNKSTSKNVPFDALPK